MGPLQDVSERLNGNRRERIQATAAILASLDPDAKREVLNMAGRLREANDVESLGKAILNNRHAYGAGELKGAETSGAYEQGADVANAGRPYDPFGVSMENLEHAMRYQPWNPVQVEQGDRVREALTSVGRVFLRELGDTPLRRRLLEEVLQLRMLANMAISFPYGFRG